MLDIRLISLLLFGLRLDLLSIITSKNHYNCFLNRDCLSFYLLQRIPRSLYKQNVTNNMRYISVKLAWIPLFLSYLEYQYEQQRGRHDGVHLSLFGQGVEICECIPRVLQV